MGALSHRPVPAACPDCTWVLVSLATCLPIRCTLPTSRKHTMSTKDVYIAKMKTQLDELNIRMEQLGDKAIEAQEAARATYRKDLAKLHQQSEEAKAKMEELTAAGEDRWDAMVTEMEKVRDAFVHSFSYFKSQV